MSWGQQGTVFGGLSCQQALDTYLVSLDGIMAEFGSVECEREGRIVVRILQERINLQIQRLGKASSLS